MKNWLIETIAAIFSGCLVMIFHEFPKAFLTYRMDKKMYHKALFRLQKIFRFREYLDGLGLFFLIIGSAGFSRPYLIAKLQFPHVHVLKVLNQLPILYIL